MTVAEQRDAARERARQVRGYRSRTRRELRAVGIKEALELVGELLHYGQPALLASLAIGDLLTWVVRLQRADVMCKKARVPFHTPLGKLDDNDRRALLHQLHTARF